MLRNETFMRPPKALAALCKFDVMWRFFISLKIRKAK